MPKIDKRLYLCITLAVLVLPGCALAQDWKEFCQDFRGGKALIDEWKFIGNKEDKPGMNTDAKGLRITIPKTRKSYQVVGIRLQFPLSGDFEITGTYEIIDVEKPPPGGQPVGIAFNLVVANDHKKLAKVGRFMHPVSGDVHLAETWMPDGKRPVITVPAKSKTGQARLVRQGEKVSYLVADDDGKFAEIFSSDFSAEDLEIVRFGANNNATPAGVDVRIIEVRIRPLAAAGDAPKAAPQENPVAASEQRAMSRGWLVAFIIIGALVLLMIAALVGVVFFIRRKT